MLQVNFIMKKNIIKDVRNLFKMKKFKKIKINNAAIKGIRNLFRLKKKTKQLKTA